MRPQRKQKKKAERESKSVIFVDRNEDNTRSQENEAGQRYILTSITAGAIGPNEGHGRCSVKPRPENDTRAIAVKLWNQNGGERGI